MEKKRKTQPNIYSENGINLNALDKHFQQATDEEKKYWQQNDAKFRAVAQKVPTYDDFKSIVDASHLRPLDPKERIDFLAEEAKNLDAKRKGASWNGVTTNGGSSHVTSLRLPSIASPDFASLKIPGDDHEFQKNWRLLKKCLDGDSTLNSEILEHQRNRLLLDYVSFVGVERLEKIWRVEVGDMSDVIEAVDWLLTEHLSQSEGTEHHDQSEKTSHHDQSEGTSDLSQSEGTSCLDQSKINLHPQQPVTDLHLNQSKTPSRLNQSEMNSHLDQSLTASPPDPTAICGCLTTVSMVMSAMRRSQRFNLSADFLGKSQKEKLAKVLKFAKLD